MMTSSKGGVVGVMRDSPSAARGGSPRRGGAGCPGTALISSTVARCSGRRPSRTTSAARMLRVRGRHRGSRRAPTGVIAASRRWRWNADRETVRLVADVLQDVQRLRRPRDRDRIGTSRDVHLLEPLRERRDGDATDTRVLHRAERSVELSPAPVDQDELRTVRELLRPRARLDAASPAPARSA